MRKYYARSHTTSTMVLLFMKGSFTCPARRWMDATPAMSLLSRYKINTCTNTFVHAWGDHCGQECTQCRLYHSEHKAESLSLWSFCRWMSSTTWTELLILTIFWVLSSSYIEGIIYPQSYLATAWQAPITMLVCNTLLVLFLYVRMLILWYPVRTYSRALLADSLYPSYCLVPVFISKWTAVCVKLCFRAWCNNSPLVHCFPDAEAVWNLLLV